MIQFAISNPAVETNPKNVLYVGDSNTLNFSFSEFVSNNDNTNNNDSIVLNQGDVIKILIKTGLLEAAFEVQMEANSDWGFKYEGTSTNDIFVLTALHAVTISPLEACIITLNEVKLDNLSTNVAFSTQYVIGGRNTGGTTEAVITLFPPDTKQDLRTALSFNAFINDDQPDLQENILYISDTKLDPPIANSIHLNISFSGQDSLATGWSDKETPQFTVFFTYGPEDDDLTDDFQSVDKPYNALTSAWNIGAGLSGRLAPYWNLKKPIQNTGEAYPVWIIQPVGNNQDLFTRQMPSLDLDFSNVISRLGSGVALMYVTWNHIPGYYDSALVLPLNKQRFPPQIISLECSNPNQDTPEALQLSWKIFAAKTMQISWDDGLQTKAVDLSNTSENPQLVYTGGDNSIIPDRLQTNLVFTAENSNKRFSNSKNLLVSVQDLPAPNLSQFQGVYQQVNGNWQIAFSWYAQDIDTGHYFVLNGVQLAQRDVVQKEYTRYGYPFSYTLLLDMNVVPSLFTLELKDTVNNKQGAAQCTPEADPNFLPQIVSFSATLERDEHQNPQVLFTATLKSVLDNAQVYALSNVGNPPLTLDVNTGVWSACFGVNDGAPVQQTYTLQALNRWGSQYVYKTIQTGFGVAQSIQCWPDGFMPLDMCLNPAGDTLYVLSLKGNMNYALNSVAVQGLDNQTLIASFDVSILGWIDTSNPLYSTLSVSPDNTQIMLTAPGLQVAILLTTTPARVTQLGKLSLVVGGSAARFAGNQIIFVINQSEMYLFNPTPDKYGWSFPEPYGYQTMNAGQDSPTYTALAIRPDGQRGFVAARNGGDGCLYWFSTDPNQSGNPIAKTITGCNGICGLAMANNNWLYGVFQWSDNNIRLFAFDTTDGQPYDGDCATNFGVFTGGRMQIAVSSDNSFVAVSNTNNNLAWLLGGTSKMNTPPTLLQDNMLSQELVDGCSMVFTKDNSRLFVAGSTGGESCLFVLEPVFS